MTPSPRTLAFTLYSRLMAHDLSTSPRSQVAYAHTGDLRGVTDTVEVFRGCVLTASVLLKLDRMEEENLN